MSTELPDIHRDSTTRWGTIAASTSGLLERLLEAATAANDSNRVKARSTLESALALLVTSNDPIVDGSQRPARGGLAPWQAKRVTVYIRDHLGSRMKTSELAELVQLSHSHFSRAFAVTFRETPAAYVVGQRLRLARHRMLTTDESLAEIALDCGFCDQAHFSRVFRRSVGLSPLTWRRLFAR